jgi:hypothetical protein
MEILFNQSCDIYNKIMGLYSQLYRLLIHQFVTEV